MLKLVKVLTLPNGFDYAYGPHGYAYYFDTKKENWMLSASISNNHLENLVKEKEDVHKQTC